jgi:hypothetical protein
MLKGGVPEPQEGMLCDQDGWSGWFRVLLLSRFCIRFWKVEEKASIASNMDSAIGR